MEMIKVKKATVLEVLKKNLSQHQLDYEEAMDGWVEKAKATLQKFLSDLNSDKARETKIEVQLPKPISFAKEYEKAIKMVEYEVRDEVEVSRSDFERYFLDEWEWKAHFLSNTSLYKNNR